MDVLIEDPQSQVLSEGEVQEVLQVLDHIVDHVVVSGEIATWGRPANESVQERFVRKKMNEPYLLRSIRRDKRKKQNQNQERKKKKPERRKERKEPN